MSWRKFLVLLRGLSRESVFILINSDEGEDGVKVIDGDDEQASDMVRSFFG